MKNIIRQLFPPLLWNGFSYVKKKFVQSKIFQTTKSISYEQDLDIYWKSDMAKTLEKWGEGNVWDEIALLLINCRGKTLDIACGTGRVIDSLSRFKFLDIYGCDISDLLVGKAVERGIALDHIIVADATKLPYEDNCFDYAYSIGSLEHFTEMGILQFLSECNRVVKKASFHLIPVSKSGEDEGWIKHDQSFFNNTIGWWLEKYSAFFGTVYVLNSGWKSDISEGRWFKCLHQDDQGNL